MDAVTVAFIYSRQCYDGQQTVVLKIAHLKLQSILLYLKNNVSMYVSVVRQNYDVIDLQHIAIQPSTMQCCYRRKFLILLYWCSTFWVQCFPKFTVINNQHFATPYDWLNKFYNCYMATVAIIINGRGFGIDTRCGNQPNRSQLALYKALIYCNSR